MNLKFRDREVKSFKIKYIVLYMLNEVGEVLYCGQKGLNREYRGRGRDGVGINKGKGMIILFSNYLVIFLKSMRFEGRQYVRVNNVSFRSNGLLKIKFNCQVWVIFIGFRKITKFFFLN